MTHAMPLYDSTPMPTISRIFDTLGAKQFDYVLSEPVPSDASDDAEWDALFSAADSADLAAFVADIDKQITAGESKPLRPEDL